MLSGSDSPALDAELVHQAGESKPRADDADRTDKAGAVSIDFIRSRGDVVTARGTDVINDGVDLFSG